MSEPILYTFPMPPDLLNARMHFRTKNRLHDQWKTRALVGDRKLRGQRPRRPYERVRITAIFYPRQMCDFDNLTARLKWPLDYLKERLIIADDSPRHVTLTGIPEQRVGGKPTRLEIFLEVLQ